MTDDHEDQAELWYRASTKNTAVFTLMWLGEAFLVLMFINWLFHASTSMYLFMIPWGLMGLIMVLRPKWIVRAVRAWRKDQEHVGEQLEKHLPPGFP